MFTQCPDCGTVFRVTATVLRAARGQVRCGVCDATFDALQYLTEESDVEADEGAAAPEAAARSPEQAWADVAGADAVDDESDDEEDERDEHDDDLNGTGVEPDAVDERAPGGPTDAAAADRPRAAPERYYDDTGEHEGFPLEELDDPIDVIASAGSGPAPEFPPFAPDDAVRLDAAAAATAESGHYEIAIDELETAAPDSEPEREPAPQPIEQFAQRAGRNTPSADEDRALAEIAAALARRAQSTPAGGSGTGDEQPSLEMELLDPSLAENIVLSGQDDVSDSALEFNLPVEDWDQVFVPDEGAATIPPLDPSLARAQSDALAPDVADEADEQDENEDADAVTAASGEDEIEIDLDVETDAPVDADERVESDDDVDLDAVDLREHAADRAPPVDVIENDEDILANGDDFAPLRAAPAEQAATAPAATPEVKPRPGTTLDEFDALVAAAADRAAAKIAARAGASAPTTGATSTVAAPLAAAAANVGAPAATPGGTPFHDPLVDALDGTAESAWFTARRDSAPDDAAAESPETIQFDAQRFQAIVRGRRRRPWWRTALYAVGSLVLTLALGAQAVHYWRESLAQDGMFGPPLRALYARLGVPLEPRWNLGAFDVKQWGATADVRPGTLRVRASIVNRAARAQPHPLLRVTLLDRFSAKVARREFMPAEYLPGRAAPSDMLAAGARVDADLVIADPGSDAVGFELDVCLKRRGVLECAGDAKLAVP